MSPSPQLIIQPKKILENHRKMSRLFQNFQIHYAMKANPHPKILGLLKEADASFETASWEEILTLLKIGVPPQRIIFSNPVKPVSAIEQALHSGVCKFVFDSLEELDKFKSMPLDHRIQLFFRISVSNQGAVWDLNQKFGCFEEQWKEVYQMMSSQKIRLYGITFHVGSQCESIRTWENALLSTQRSIQLSHSYGLRPRSVNIGGGFPIQHKKGVPELKDIHQIIQRHTQTWEKEKLGIRELIMEPGRFLVGTSGTLKTTIIGVSKRNGVQWVYLDCGLFSGMMETIHGSIEYPIISTGEGELEKVQLCGPTCDGLDILYEARIPRPRLGDHLYFANAGAYTNVYGTRFNGFRPPEVVFQKDNGSLLEDQKPGG